MNRIWAPWRLKYIKSDKKKNGCILCNVLKENHTLLYQDSLCFVVLNKYPYNNGHLLICPNSHKATLEELTHEEMGRVGLLLQKSTRILKEVCNPMGFNIGLNLGRAAGAGIEDHLHFHIVPRWVGDGNFMPVIGKTKILSADLTEVHNSLLPKFEELKKTLCG